MIMEARTGPRLPTKRTYLFPGWLEVLGVLEAPGVQGFQVFQSQEAQVGLETLEVLEAQ